MPTISCPWTANGHWYATPATTSLTCTFTSSAAAELEWTLNGVDQGRLTTNTSGAATKTGIPVPAAGAFDLKVRGVSNAGRASTWTNYSFYTGGAVITTPTEGAGSASTFTVNAVSEPGASSVSFQYRKPSGAWAHASAARLGDGSTWDGISVTNSTYLSSLPELTWTPAAEPGINAPQVLETRIVFVYPNSTWRTSPVRTVQLTAHDFTVAGATTAIGLGTVSLGSGEFQTSAADASIGGLSVGRSHLSNAKSADTPAGIFGRGWTSSVAAAGPAAFRVIDQRGSAGSFVLETPQGVAYTFKSPETAATSTLTGQFNPIGDATALGATLMLDAATNVLTYTESQGAKTTFELHATAWLPTATIGTTEPSTTSYYYDHSGNPTWIIAPPPPGLGVACTRSVLVAGCRALHITYATLASGDVRAQSVEYVGWDPQLTDSDGDAGQDGLPDLNADITTITVAKYAYNTNGTLLAVWDPRVGEGASALKTSYEYATSGAGTSARTRLTKITPPGQQPWQINYDSDGAVTTVTRPMDPAVGSGNAIWTIRYGIALNAEGDGLPNLSATRTSAWGQTGPDAPVTGAAVFPPDRVPAATPSATDWSYADLLYWNSRGRLTNAVSYGAGAWQISTTKYDPIGNQTWSLTPAAKATALQGAATPADSAAEADRYATHTLYKTDGTRLEATYGPMRGAIMRDGTTKIVRGLTQYVYDDEADPSLVPGRPTTGVPDGGFGVIAEIRSSATDEASPGIWAATSNTPPTSVNLYDTTLSQFQYDPAKTGDPSGWTLRQPTYTKIQNGSGWDTAITRYDATGRVIQTRTPEGVATGEQTRWHDLAYYTADTAAAVSGCRNKPQWAGLPCWEGPAQQPTTGRQIPSTFYAGYSFDLQSTRAVTTSGSATNTEIGHYDAAGRSVGTTVSTTGVNDQQLPDANITYSNVNGQPTSVSNGTSTIESTYDTWARPTSQSDGAGNTAYTTYTAAGDVATLNDGKGTYSFSYNESSSSGAGERRAVPTSVNLGIAGVSGSLRATYDMNGNVATQSFPTTTGLTEYRHHKLTGEMDWRYLGSTASIALVGAANELDIEGRVRLAHAPTQTIKYSYDDRGRLRTVGNDRGSGNCDTTTYARSPDSNQTSLTSSNPCAGIPTSTQNFTYDSADRVTVAGYGPGAYVYDDLGRTTTLPGNDIAHFLTSEDVNASYHSNDMVAALERGNKRQTFSLDALGRISTIKTLTAGVSLVEKTNHYADSSDSPAWTETRTRANASSPWTIPEWTRYVRGIDGNLAVTQSSSGTPQVHAYDAHGDILTTISMSGTAWGQFQTYSPFGLPDNDVSFSGYGRYDWLGAAQRDGDVLGNLVLMGARLYNPTTGRFLSRDPVQGGNDNPYVYPPDPINQMDISGEAWTMSTWSQKPFTAGTCTNFGLARAFFGCGFTGTLGTLYNYKVSVYFTPKDQDRYELASAAVGVAVALTALALTMIPSSGGAHRAAPDKFKWALMGFIGATWTLWLANARGRNVVIEALWTYRVSGTGYVLGKKLRSFTYNFPFGYTPLVWIRYG